MIKIKSRKTPSAVGTNMKHKSLAQRKRVASTGSDIILPGPLFHVSEEEKELRKVKKERDRKTTDGRSPDRWRSGAEWKSASSHHHWGAGTHTLPSGSSIGWIRNQMTVPVMPSDRQSGFLLMEKHFDRDPRDERKKCFVAESRLVLKIL